MTRWDPFGVHRYHEEVREKIRAGEHGYAQSDVSGQIVSYCSLNHPPTIRHESPISKAYTEIVEEILVDVARGDGIASDRTFPRARIEWMIKDRSAYPKDWYPKMHAEAETLKELLNKRPSLFVD